MAQTILTKRGLEANRTGIIPATGELIWTTDSKKLYMGDGSTAGGIDFIAEAQGAYIPLTQKGAVDGVATLDSGSKIPNSQLQIIDDISSSQLTTYSSSYIDTIMTQGVSYRGKWDASTNSPTLSDSSGTHGYYYLVDVAGTIDLGSGSKTYDVGDTILYHDPDGTGGNPGTWEKIDNTNRVDEVNGKIGIVVLDGTDIDLTTYVKPAASGVILDTDNINIAIGKLERGLDDAVAGGGETNVQSDWTQSDAGADDFIKNKPVTITTQQADDITTNNAKNSYPSADATKLSGIEAGAEVNVQSDWNASSGSASILNKPSIVAEFADLSDTTAYTSSEAGKVVTVNPAGDGLVYQALGAGGVTMAWTDLSDTPGSLGAATIGKATRVNNTGTALEFVDHTLAVQDDVTLSTPLANEVLMYDDVNSVWVNSPLPVNGDGTFTGLTDTPSSYASGDAGKFLRVNSSEDAVEFTTTSINEMSDVSAAAANNNDVLTWDGSSWVPAPIDGGTF